jgi:hypothetical protein
MALIHLRTGQGGSPESDSKEKFSGDTLLTSLLEPRWLHSARESRNVVLFQFTRQNSRETNVVSSEVGNSV